HPCAKRPPRRALRARSSRLEKDPGSIGEVRAQRFLAPRDGFHELGGRRADIHARVDADDQIVAVLHRDEIFDLDDTRLRFQECADGAVARLSPISRLLISIASTDATTISSTPTPMLPSAS